MTSERPRRSLHNTPHINRTMLTGLAALAFLFLAACTGVHTGERDFSASAQLPDTTRLPELYGEVVFHHDGAGPNHLYVIGVGHRDSITRRNGNKTARIQAEVYKIAEWLVLNKHVELLVPEGFFEKPAGKACRYDRPRKTERLKGASLKRLEKCFADDKNPTHAGLLLLRNYRLGVKQIEDRALYDAALDCLVTLENNRNSPSATLPVESELKYLQERRTASMLQRIPDVVGDEFREGNIRQRQAIFTVGLNHLSEIIQYVTAKKIEVCPPAPASLKNENYIAEVNLLNENFGITIIIPRTLAEDDDVLKMTRLDLIVSSQISTPVRP